METENSTSETNNQKYSLAEFWVGSVTSIVFLLIISLLAFFELSPSCEGVDSTACGMMELAIFLIGGTTLFIVGLIELFVFNISKKPKPVIHNKIYLKFVSAFYLMIFFTILYSNIISIGNFQTNFKFSIFPSIISVYLLKKFSKTNSYLTFNKKIKDFLKRLSLSDKLKYIIKLVISIIINLLIFVVNVLVIKSLLVDGINHIIFALLLLLAFSMILSVIIIKEILYLKEVITCQNIEENKLLLNSHFIMLACLLLSLFSLVIISNIT